MAGVVGGRVCLRECESCGGVGRGRVRSALHLSQGRAGFIMLSVSGSAFYIKINFKQKLVFCVSAFNQFILAMRRVEHCGSAWGTESGSV